MFKNRLDAAKKLAAKLSDYKNKDVVVLAIPRGGVEIGSYIAEELNASLDIVIPRKIRSQQNPEFAIGALAGKNKIYLNEKVIRQSGINKEYLEAEIQNQLEEIKRREVKYLGNRARAEIKDKIVIIVDDGVATGSTAIAAIRAIRGKKPKGIVFAAPVASRESKKILENEADKVIFFEVPDNFFAVGQFYELFEQTSDDEVKSQLSNLTSKA